MTTIEAADTEAAKAALREWRETHRDRNRRIIHALYAGVTMHRTSVLLGVGRHTVERAVDEYRDAAGKPVIDDAALLRVQARAASGLTADEFDAQLAAGSQVLLGLMRQAARKYPPELWTRAQPQIAAMVDRARAAVSKTA